ncbi:MAG: transglycosylase SLT domain-containing protein, partial [Methyloligellaceae bacterium]
EAINSGKPKAAFEIARNYGSVTINNLNQARFLSGWLALRFVRKTDEAFKHFTDLSKSADGPRTRSRSHFWLGRTALARKDQKTARQHFTAGAKYFNTFYGQLSRQRIDTNLVDIKIESPRFATEKSAEEFFKRDAIQALIVAQKAELKTTVVRFLTRLRNRSREPADLHVLAELASRLGHPQQAVRIGKRAMFFDIPLVKFAYPVDALPEFEPLRPLPERALIFAIARQESEFNPKIVSHAGARGLMQVMPITARHVSRQHKIKYELKRLLTDPAYNCRIGSAYIADRMDEFDGSYVKTIAGFNAGPGRVRQWMRKFGDPGTKNIDPIDWIERIPFTETRNYVQKVLANVQVYRARLGTPNEALRIVADLNRGRS